MNDNDIFNKEKEFDEKVDQIAILLAEAETEERQEKITKLVEDIKRAYLQAHFDAVTDSMTGCYNKKHIKEIFHYQYANAKRTKQFFSIIILDIDYLKYINDTFGHDEGDKAIKGIAAATQRAVRETDIVFRFGGDEFVIFCIHNDKKGIDKVVSRMVEDIAKLNIGKDFVPTVTMGVVSKEPRQEPNVSYSDMFREADELLYSQKHNRKPPKFLTR